MLPTIADQLTAQFYNWEYRGRGRFVFSEPVQLEPGFVPFFFHTLPVYEEAIIDDGKRHTLFRLLLVETRKIFSPKRTQPPVPRSEQIIEACPDEAAVPRTCFLISFPKGQKISAAETEHLLLMLGNCQYPVSFEIVATGEKIVVQYTCAHTDAPFLYSQLKAYFPMCILTEKEDALLALFDHQLHVIDFGLREEFMRPLAMPSSFDPDPLISLFGTLDYVQHGEGGALQILFAGCRHPWAESILRAVSDDDGGAFFADAPEMLSCAKQKIAAPLFAATIRAIGMSEREQRAKGIAWHLADALIHCSRSHSNQLLPLSDTDYPYGNQVQDVVYRQTHRLGMLLNSRELAAFAHYPSAFIASGKLERDTKKTKAAPESAIGHALSLGINEHQGKTAPVGQSREQRLRHTHIIGATGTGKSTLLLSMIAQDIAQHNGISVLDPHGDLIQTILASAIPPERIHDVLLIDPADAEYPVGFNILSAHSEIEKDILSSDLVAAFRRLATSWGDQMNSIFANAILAFLESKGGTLADLRRFLVDKTYREKFLKTVSDPAIVYYWHREYPLLKSGSIGSILTRLDAFLRPKLIRNMVCQRKSIDFDRLLNERKIILVKLSQGLIGAENSFLLGTFIISKLQQVAMQRQAITEHERTTHFLYADEFHHYATRSMNTLLSGARKYNLGLVLAYQSMQQIADAEIAASIIANAGTRICFRVGETDAKKLAEGFASFEANDLQNLSTGEAIARLERPEHDFSMTTMPVSAPSVSAELIEQVIIYSREQYSTPRQAVEMMIAESMQLPQYKDVQKVSKSAKPEKQKSVSENKPIIESVEIPASEVQPFEPRDVKTPPSPAHIPEDAHQAYG